jgi:DNA-binding NtrC family response regulator
MGDELSVAAVVGKLVEATVFDDAALVTLRSVLDACAGVLSTSRFARSGHLVRAVVHLRPSDGYRGLAVLEAGASDLATPDGQGGHLTSTTAWRWVDETRCALSIDVNVGRVQLHGAERPAFVHAQASRGPREFNGGESRLGLLARDVTHLLVLPLRGPRASVDGMIALEAACRPAIGTPFMWGDCVAALQLLADVAAPYLVGLPTRPPRSLRTDPLLPVVGEATSGIVELLATFARQDEPVLISGPTGSGKSRLARWCHEQSARQGKPFEVLDLCAIPEDLQLPELFGWRKGAFTGATRDKLGCIAQARGGTLFIDEIDNLSPRAQAGLLRVLEEGTYRRLGDDGRELAADVRFIVGTNADLQTAVREKRFREDLYYRINVLPVRLPPLRERRDEIAPWARYMTVRRHGSESAGGVSLTSEAERFLVAQEWPGNLRQLDNIVRRAYAVALAALGGIRSATLVLGVEHVRRAMEYESEDARGSLGAVLFGAATAFAKEAERRGAGALDLDLADAFKGFVLAAATERLGGSREEAFALLGREKLARDRNHHKVFRREIDRAEQLCRLLGERSPFGPLTRDDESGSD